VDSETRVNDWIGNEKWRGHQELEMTTGFRVVNTFCNRTPIRSGCCTKKSTNSWLKKSRRLPHRSSRTPDSEYTTSMPIGCLAWRELENPTKAGTTILGTARTENGSSIVNPASSGT
jgi:hypothetical protein